MAALVDEKEDPTDNQTANSSSSELEGGDDTTGHPNIPAEPDRGEDGSNADLQSREWSLESDNEQQNEGTMITFTTSSKECPSLPQTGIESTHEASGEAAEGDEALQSQVAGTSPSGSPPTSTLHDATDDVLAREQFLSSREEMIDDEEVYDDIIIEPSTNLLRKPTEELKNDLSTNSSASSLELDKKSNNLTVNCPSTISNLREPDKEQLDEGNPTTDVPPHVLKYVGAFAKVNSNAHRLHSTARSSEEPDNEQQIDEGNEITLADPDTTSSTKESPSRPQTRSTEAISSQHDTRQKAPCLAKGEGHVNLPIPPREDQGVPKVKADYGQDQQSNTWYDAIARSDCDRLRKLLKKSNSILWKCERKRRTALHIAAMEGDSRLAKRVLDTLITAQRDDKFDFVFELHNPDSDFRSLGDYIEAVDASTGRTALEMTDVISGIRPYILSTQKDILEDRWNRAIERKDCVMLRILLEDKSYEVMKSEIIGWRGRSALHIAAMQGCFPLAKLLLDRTFSAEFGRAHYIAAVDPGSGLTALQMAEDITGNRSISQYIKFTQQRMSGEDYEEPYFFEAYPRTQWHDALKTYCTTANADNRELQKLLLWNSRLLLETFRGLTVLYVAMLQDDFELVKAVVSLFPGTTKKIEWGEFYSPRILSWKVISETPVDYDKISDLLSDAQSYPGVKDQAHYYTRIESLRMPPVRGSATPALELARKLEVSDEIIQILEEMERDPPDNDEADQGVAGTSLTPWPGSALIDLIRENWHTNWNEGFMADVDFNFEKGPRFYLLRLHYACKDPLKFKDFLQSVCSNKYFNEFSTCVHDGQGRTLYHILLDHYTDAKPPGWAFDEIFTLEANKLSIKHAQDAKGRRLIDMILIKNYLQCNISLNPSSYFGMTFETNAMNMDDYVTSLTTYYVACTLKQSILALQIWSDTLQRDFEKLMKHGSKLLPFTIASVGNQPVFQALFRTSALDLTIVDRKGRTLLHHAADATLLDFATLLDLANPSERQIIYHFFSTVEDLCAVRKKSETEMNGQQLSFKSDNLFAVEENLRKARDEKVELHLNVGRKACILILLQAGFDVTQEDDDGKMPSIGLTYDATFQSWWYDMVVKEATDNKNSFNQAGNALSVVGTLVAATSYIGPLQPPMNYTEAGLVHTSETLVEVFMMANTLAFYLAMASVMFAVVPSLPMPREGVMSELKRARRMVLFSLCLLLVAISTIIISFAAASIVVILYHDPFQRSNILFGPSIIGWVICSIAVGSFGIRVMRLSFYDSPAIRHLYQFSFIDLCKQSLRTCVKLSATFIAKLCSVFDDLIDIFVIIFSQFHHSFVQHTQSCLERCIPGNYDSVGRNILKYAIIIVVSPVLALVYSLLLLLSFFFLVIIVSYTIFI